MSHRVVATPPPDPFPLQTLDALPAHLLTPFNGVVPPSNLLDKIARGVASAKGPVDWPHSIRATRVKLMELARIRARDPAQDQNRRIIIEEDDDAYSPGEVLQQTTNTVPTRPLYRRSSMDFMNSAKIDLHNNEHIARYVLAVSARTSSPHLSVSVFRTAFSARTN